jgi:hypothetical protein
MIEYSNTSSSRQPADRPDTHEIFSPQLDLRLGNRYLTGVTGGDDNYCLILCTLPPSGAVPMQ